MRNKLILKHLLCNLKISGWDIRGVSTVQLLSCVQLCDAMDFSMPGLPVHHQLLEFTQTLVHWVSDAIQPSPSLLSPSPPAFSVSLFSNESVLPIRWPKYWSFLFSPSNEYLGLISFRMDWLELLAVQGTLKSLLQHHSSIASILHTIFFSHIEPVSYLQIFLWFTPKNDL